VAIWLYIATSTAFTAIRPALVSQKVEGANPFRRFTGSSP
jgi:hypothetical protein